MNNLPKMPSLFHIWVIIGLVAVLICYGELNPQSTEAFSATGAVKPTKVAKMTPQRKRAKKVRISIEMLDEMVKDKKMLPGQLAALPEVPVPRDNLQTELKVELGKMLFFDPRLSSDGHIACSTCHSPGLGYSDGLARAMGFREELGRHSPTVLNAAYNKLQFWDGRSPSLEDQALGPILAAGEMNNTKENVVAFLNSVPGYKKMFNQVFGHDPVYEDVGRAIAAFERTIVTPNAPFDRYMNGNLSALSPQEKRGLIVFVSKGSCSQCHKGPNFTDDDFHNLDVPQAGPLKDDPGRLKVTGVKEDKGAFKTPTLRNIDLTAPYMHNGAFSTLEEVIAFYDQGGGPEPNKDIKMKALDLSNEEKGNLIAFLKSLTGTQPKVEFPLLPQ